MTRHPDCKLLCKTHSAEVSIQNNFNLRLGHGDGGFKADWWYESGKDRASSLIGHANV